MLAKLFSKPFVAAALSSSLALVVGGHYFPSVRVMASSALIGLSLSALTQRHLDMNRTAIWEEKSSPYEANLNLAAYFLKVFSAVFLVALLFDATSTPTMSRVLAHIDRYRNALSPLLLHNGGVLLASAFLSLVYGAGGLTLVLGWNALNWSDSLSRVLFGTQGEPGSQALLAAALLPHLIFEVLSYVLAGMAGAFLGKALLKYSVFSEEFYRVSRACVVIVAFSLLALVIGGLFEVYVAGAARGVLMPSQQP